MAKSMATVRSRAHQLSAATAARMEHRHGVVAALKQSLDSVAATVAERAERHRYAYAHEQMR